MFENLFSVSSLAVISYCLLAISITFSMFKILLMVSNGFTVVNRQVNINLFPSLSVLIILKFIIALFVTGFVYLGYSITKDQLIVIAVTFIALRKMTGINDDNREESFHDNLYVYVFVPVKLLVIAIIHFLTLGLFRATMVEYKITHDYIAEIRLNDGDPFNVFYNELLNNLGDLMYTFCLIRIIDPKFKEDPFWCIDVLSRCTIPFMCCYLLRLPLLLFFNICTFGMSTAIKCECEIITNWIVYTHLNNSVSNFLIKLCNGFTYCMLPLANDISVIIGQRDEILSLYNEVKVLPENTIGKPKSLIEHGSLMEAYRNKFN